MNVSELAEELDVAPSMILDQCQRFGIAASWAGAELTGSDLIILRAELASSDAIDLTAADPVPDPVAAEVEAPASALPPTVVASMPELIEDLAEDAGEPEPEPAPAAHVDPFAAGTRRPGFDPAGAAGGPVVADELRTPRPTKMPEERRLDRSARTGLIALAIGVLALLGSNLVDLPILVAVIWLVAAVALVVAVIDSFLGRRHAQVHPERTRGLWLATISLVLALGGIVALTAMVLTAVGDDPPADAPLGVGDLHSVQVARWGYQRTARLADDGWHQPARADGTCWNNGSGPDRGEDREELDQYGRQTPCKNKHQVEVVSVFAVDRDADSPYPGAEGIVVAAQRECGDAFAAAKEEVPTAELKVEYPTETGWDDADHDVACLIVTPTRTGALAE